MIQVDDKKCEQLVNFFNNIKLKTKYCCEGHTDYDDFWIMFDDEVQDDHILNFLYKIEKFGEGYGKFNKWLRLNKDIEKTTVLSNWMYCISPYMIKMATMNNEDAEKFDFDIFNKAYNS